MKEMVEVLLYEDGNYEVNDIDDSHVTQHLWGIRNHKSCEIYFCTKDKWKEYLLKLLSTKNIDKQIAELKKRKKKIEDLKTKIIKEIEGVK